MAGRTAAAGPGLGDEKQPQAGQETAQSQHRGEGQHAGNSLGSGSAREPGWKAGGWGQPSGPRRGSAERRQVKVSLMAEQLTVLSPGGQLPTTEQSQASRERFKPKSRQEAQTCTRTTPTHILRRLTGHTGHRPPCLWPESCPRQRRGLCLSSSESLPSSLVQAKGWERL